MHHSLIFALAATRALAAPAKRQATSQLSVLIANGDFSVPFTFDSGVRSEKAIESTEEIREVTLEISTDVQDQEQRCSIFNAAGLVIQVKRGDSVATSFGVGEKWFLDGNADGEVADPTSNEPFDPASPGSDEIVVRSIVCNPDSDEVAGELAGEADLEFTLPVEGPLGGSSDGSELPAEGDESVYTQPLEPQVPAEGDESVHTQPLEPQVPAEGDESVHTQPIEPQVPAEDGTAPVFFVPISFAAVDISAGSEDQGLVNSVNLQLPADFEPQTLRCQATSTDGEPIKMQRGENEDINEDITFADGGNGPWRFDPVPLESLTVVCDPAFVQDSQ